MNWNPAQYARYADARARPAINLIERLPMDPAPKLIIDLGCGDGRVTALLKARWPMARIIGVDNDAAMIAAARGNQPDIEWIEADIADYVPAMAPDLIFSNAALHWLPDHQQLFKKLLAQLTPNGRLAVQMPNNFDQPSHQLTRALAASPRWHSQLAGAADQSATASPADYYAIFSAAGAKADIWTTDYLQVMPGENAVLEWLKGSLLVPIMAALSPAETAEFLKELAPKLQAAYPLQKDGNSLFPFKRLFLIAEKSA